MNRRERPWRTVTAWYVGDDIDTDQIMPARYLSLTDPDDLAVHVLESITTNWPGRIRPGDILVAGANFGCGSSREHAALGLKGTGIRCVLALSFSRIFYRNAINIGLQLVRLPSPVKPAVQGGQIWIRDDPFELRVAQTEAVIRALPTPSIVRNIIAAGGLMPYVAVRTQKPRASARSKAAGEHT